jgi:hypothetical protein
LITHFDPGPGLRGRGVTEEGRDKALRDAVEGGHIVDVEAGPFPDRAPHHAQGYFHKRFGDGQLLLVHQLNHQLRQPRKGAVHHLQQGLSSYLSNLTKRVRFLNSSTQPGKRAIHHLHRRLTIGLSSLRKGPHSPIPRTWQRGCPKPAATALILPHQLYLGVSSPPPLQPGKGTLHHVDLSL